VACSAPAQVTPGRGPEGAPPAAERLAPAGPEKLLGIRWGELRPGETIVVTDERPLREPLHIRRARGTAEQPITVRAAPGASPTLLSSIVIEDSAHLVLDGLVVKGSRYPGIQLKRGTHHVTVTSCRVLDDALGVWFTDGAGCGHRIVGNEISGSATHGIAVDAVNCTAGQETLLARNRVHDNAQHGIEIHGNGYVVEANEVFRNGAGRPGTSGIHVFSRSAQENTGDHNVIRRNVVYDNRQPSGPDGNGIQLDQWCDDNEVSYNVVFSNDGAGIIAYDAADARITNNTVYGNMRDPDGKHPFKGEIVLATDAERRVNRVRNVQVARNIVVAERRGVACLVVDRLTAENPLEFGTNLMFHRGGGNVFVWGDAAGSDAAAWSRVTRQAQGQIFADPLFASDRPARLEDFRPRRGSPAAARASRVDRQRGAAGKEGPRSGAADLGALEVAPP
jgi:parallel beta-helix repeat protein